MLPSAYQSRDRQLAHLFHTGLSAPTLHEPLSYLTLTCLCLPHALRELPHSLRSLTSHPPVVMSLPTFSYAKTSSLHLPATTSSSASTMPLSSFSLPAAWHAMVDHGSGKRKAADSEYQLALDWLQSEIDRIAKRHQLSAQPHHHPAAASPLCMAVVLTSCCVRHRGCWHVLLLCVVTALWTSAPHHPSE